jgi:hypothetical protein
VPLIRAAPPDGRKTMEEKNRNNPLDQQIDYLWNPACKSRQPFSEDLAKSINLDLSSLSMA